MTFNSRYLGPAVLALLLAGVVCNPARADHHAAPESPQERKLRPLVLQADFAGLVMTGVAYSVEPRLRVHNLRPLIPLYDIAAASRSLAYNAQSWPSGSVFVSVVDPGVGTDRKSVVLKTRSGLYFVSPDNGSLSGAAAAYGIEAVREIDESVNRIPGSDWSHTFHGRDVYSFTGARLAAGVIDFEAVGPLLAPEVVRLAEPLAERDGDVLRGIVAGGVDRLGNAFFNIDRTLFEALQPEFGDSFAIRISQGEELAWEGTLPYVRSFGSVAIGEPLLFLNSSGQLAVAINQGNFAAAKGIGAGPEWQVTLRRVSPDPASPDAAPAAAYEKPAAAYEKPAATYEKPAATYEKPAATPMNPAASYEKPGASEELPVPKAAAAEVSPPTGTVVSADEPEPQPAPAPRPDTVPVAVEVDTVPIAVVGDTAALMPPPAPAAVSPGGETPTAVISRQHWIPSRDTYIPATLTYPASAQSSLPLVLLLHGHGGTRHEAGGFTQLAAALARRGIASIRMDFPGCGESIEPFRRNNLTNMLADARAARSFAMTQLNVDPDRQGLVGFSMGGRIALHLVPELSGLKAVTLWAPSATDGAAHLMDYVGGPQRWAAMRAQAVIQGYAPFTTFWGQRQQLGARWFTDLEASHPVPIIEQFEEALLVVYGSEDPVIPPAAARAVIEQAELARLAALHEVNGADHGFGLFDDRPELTAETVRVSADFFAAELMVAGHDSTQAPESPAVDAPVGYQEPPL